MANKRQITLVTIHEKDTEIAKRMKTAENFRRKSLTQYTTQLRGSALLQKMSAMHHHSVEQRLRLNLRTGRNAGHHQQLAYNATGAIVPV